MTVDALGMNHLSTLAPLHHRHSELIEHLERLAFEYKLVLIPAGLDNIHAIPQVALGPERSGHSLDEFIDFLYRLGCRGLYLVDGHLHLHRPQCQGTIGPVLEVQALAGGVLHRWTATVQI